MFDNTMSQAYILIDPQFYDFFDVTNAVYYNDEITLQGNSTSKITSIRLKKNGIVVDTIGDPNGTTDLISGTGLLTRDGYFDAKNGGYIASDYRLKPLAYSQFLTNSYNPVAHGVFVAAQAAGTRLTLTYDAALDGSVTPSTTAFTVRADGTAIAVSGVAVNGSARTVTLTLAAPVHVGQTVTLSYADPRPQIDDTALVIQDANGNDALTLTSITVPVTNQAPVVAVPSTAVAASEQVPAAILAGATLSDADSATLASATVSITGGLAPAQDRLTFVNDGATMGNVVGSYNTATGVLSLASAGATATVVQFEAALRAVTYTNISDTPVTTARTVSVAAHDGTAASATATRTVTVAAVNDAPVAVASSGTATATGQAAAVVDAALSLSDVDSATLAKATVAITAGFVPGQDVLAFGNTDAAAYGTIAGSYDAALGVLTLSSSGASATVAQFQAALRAVTYRNTASSPGLAPRTVSITADDGTSVSAATTRVVDIVASGPTAFDDVLTGTGEDDTISLLAGNDLYTAGAGNDTVSGNEGNDTLSGNEGNDSLFGNQGDDVLYGNQGNDWLHGGQGNDWLHGGQNDDTLNGGVGDDTLWGGLGNDVLTGGTGADQFVFATNSGTDVILDFNAAEGDRLDLQGQSSTLGITQDGSTLLSLSGGGTVELRGVRPSTFTGGPTTFDDVLTGTAGNDTVGLLDGNDVYTAGTGDDTVSGNEGNDTLSGNEGNDSLFGNQGDDVLYGNQGNDWLHGGQGNDWLHGGQNDDTLNGGVGDDTLWGGLGDDVLTGGTGADQFVFATDSGTDVILDFNAAEGDRLDLQGQISTLGFTSDGSTLLSLSGGGSIELRGVDSGMNVSWFA